MTNITTSVIETVQVNGKDASLLNHKLNITGAPEMDFRTLESSGISCSVTEGLKKVTLNTVAVASFRYSFEITQYHPLTKTTVTETIAYTSKASGDTEGTINDKFRSIIALKENLHIAGTGTSTLILTAETGYAIFSVKLTSGVLSTHWGASDPVNETNVAQAAIASNTTATPSVITTSGAHGLSVGQIVTLVSNNQSKLVDGTYRVARTPLDTTLELTTLAGVPLAGTSTTTGTLDLVAKNTTGSYAALVAKGVSGLTSGSTYSELPLNYKNLAIGGAAVGGASDNLHTVYIKDSGSDGVLATNYAALNDDIKDYLGAVDNDGTTANEEAVAVA